MFNTQIDYPQITTDGDCMWGSLYSNGQRVANDDEDDETFAVKSETYSLFNHDYEQMNNNAYQSILILCANIVLQ